MGHTEKERTGRFQQLNSLQHAGVKEIKHPIQDLHLDTYNPSFYYF